MTSRPAAPELETPETDALDLQYGHRKEIFDAYRELARSLERRLSLAEAQIQQARDFIVEQSAENIGGGEKPIEFLLASYKLMAREHSLARTEIKGHMRVAKEVRDDALEEAAKVAEPRSNNPETDWERGYWAAENVISKTIRELKSRA